MTARFLRLLIALSISLLPLCQSDAASPGKLKICKQGTPDDWGDQDWWRTEVVVPAGAVFQDVGPVNSNTDPGIRLRVMTLASISIKGDERCKVVSAVIPPDEGDWGTAAIGPVITTIGPQDGRLLEILTWGKEDAPPKKLAPWDMDAVPVQATIESAIK